MNREFKDFQVPECKKILSSIIKNHENKKKTMVFLENLRKVEEDEIQEVLSKAESYYFYIKQYFTYSDEEKLKYAALKIKEFKKLSKTLPCCNQVFDSDNVGNILRHTLSLEHLMAKDQVPIKLQKDIELIFDYFRATKNINIEELSLLHKLLNENKEFFKLVTKEKTK